MEHLFDLKQFRKENNISQQALAEYLGVGQSFISQIERGMCALPQSVLNKIMNNPEWKISNITNQGEMIIEQPSGDHIEQNGSNNIGKISGDCPEILALRRENEILRQMVEELKSEKAAYWKMIENLTKK